MDLGTTGRLKAVAWCRWTVGAWQLMKDLGWKLGIEALLLSEYCSPHLVSMVPILTKA